MPHTFYSTTLFRTVQSGLTLVLSVTSCVGGKKKKVKHAAMEMQDLLKIWGIVDIDDAAGKVAPYQMKRLAAFCFNFKELLGSSNISFLRRVDIDPTTLIGAPFSDSIGHKLLKSWMIIDEFGNGEINLNNFRRWVRRRSNIIGLCLFFNHLIFGGAIRTSRRGYYTFEEFVVLSEYDKDSLYIQCSEICTLRIEMLHTET
jgi:hypothetical protein